MGAQRKYEQWETVTYSPPLKTKHIPKVIIGNSQATQQNLARKVVLLFLLVSVLSCIYVARTGVVAEQTYRLNSMKQHLAVLERDNSVLHLEIAHLKSPERIQAIASKDLGMILPEKFFFSTK